MIDFEHVYKTYETHNDENVALEDINIHIDEGEFVFILGHSGAGKSTFLKLIQMEEKPTEGKVFINGQDLTRIKRRKVPYLRRQMGVVFQDFRLIPTMTVYENVAFAMRVTNISTKKIKDRVPFALSLVGLEDKMDRLPDELSGGEQQRVAVARALGEYGATSMIAGYTPGKTATIATTVYQLWRTNDERGAMQWVLVDIVIAAVVLLAVNLLERKQKHGGKHTLAST